MKKTIFCLLGVFLLAACGFEPLYVEKKSSSLWYFGAEFDQSIAQEMSQIKIDYIKDRFGQQVRNLLLDSLTPLGQPEKPRYVLSVLVSKPEVIQQALREDITATRERAMYKVSYVMKDTNGAELFQNVSVAYVSYDILANPYSTTMASKKAQENAAKIIADDIALRIGAYFHGLKEPSGEIDN